MSSFDRWLLPLAIVAVGLWTIAWIGDGGAGAERDWRHFHATAGLLWSGRFCDLYPGVTPHLPFLHPPFFVWFLMPFGLLSRTAGYGAGVFSDIGALVAALLLLRRLLPGDRRRFAFAVVMVLASASWTVMLVLGQLSAWYLLILVGTLYLWTKQRGALAGAVASLLMCKPNLGAIFPVIFLGIAIRDRQASQLGGWCAGFLLLLGSTLPLGWSVWRQYFQSLPALVDMVFAVPAWKQHTLLAFWRSLPISGHWPILPWAVSTIPLLGVTAWAWWSSDRGPRQLPRLFGITVLFLATSTPYLHHYDTLIVALPGLVWALDPGGFHSIRLRRLCGLALFTSFVVQQISVWFVQSGPSLVGPCLGAWLLADACDLIGQTRERSDRATREPFPAARS